jgi:hypothetical protein
VRLPRGRCCGAAAARGPCGTPIFSKLISEHFFPDDIHHYLFLRRNNSSPVEIDSELMSINDSVLFEFEMMVGALACTAAFMHAESDLIECCIHRCLLARAVVYVHAHCDSLACCTRRPSRLLHRYSRGLHTPLVRLCMGMALVKSAQTNGPGRLIAWKPSRPAVPLWAGDIPRAPCGSMGVIIRSFKGVTQPIRLTCWAYSADLTPAGSLLCSRCKESGDSHLSGIPSVGIGVAPPA